eukprot:TRINITY_DN1381_c0_g2_i1.p1 TRINITY_DN1381_c0_g2~~TRINITY_DN1381_c0_g2_i1.p1  ORF type:complete len:374 (-),score=66.47 TRINITY_DN1381_c0_g2_i1:120-1241(-)
MATTNNNNAAVPEIFELQPINNVTTKTTRTFPGGIVRVVDTDSREQHSLAGIKRNISEFLNRNFLERLELHLFKDVTIWKAGIIEFFGTFTLTFMLLITACAILLHQQDYSYFPTAISIIMIPIVAFNILATATSSGGHINPTISFATLLAGLTEFPRAVIYIAFQIVGAIAASFTTKYILSDASVQKTMLAMCSIGTEQTPAQALTLEIFCDVWVLFVAFGVALDERQRQVFPPFLAPFIIGVVVAILIYVTSTISAFGNGAIAFPTRCFGPAVAMHLVTADSFTLGNGVVVKNAQWVYWVGPIISSIIIAILYRTIPPGYSVIIKEQRMGLQNRSGNDIVSSNNNNNNNNSSIIPNNNPPSLAQSNNNIVI